MQSKVKMGRLRLLHTGSSSSSWDGLSFTGHRPPFKVQLGSILCPLFFLHIAEYARVMPSAFWCLSWRRAASSITSLQQKGYVQYDNGSREGGKTIDYQYVYTAKASLSLSILLLVCGTVMVRMAKRFIGVVHIVWNVGHTTNCILQQRNAFSCDLSSLYFKRPCRFGQLIEPPMS